MIEVVYFCADLGLVFANQFLAENELVSLNTLVLGETTNAWGSHVVDTHQFVF
jgi:hypothetical protein